MGNRIFLSSPTMHGEEQKYIQEAFDTNWVAPLGKNVDEFEKGMAKYIGIKYAAALNAGTGGSKAGGQGVLFRPDLFCHGKPRQL